MLKIIKNLIYKIKSIVYKKFYEKKKITCGINTLEIRREKIVVSLTSIPKRFETLDIAIKSIMNQTLKADKIILYLDTDVDYEKIPEKIKALEEKGLEIKICGENIKPHKKYYYAMQEYRDAIIITVDDDMIYERKLIERLYDSYIKYPNCISAKRVHKMKKNSDGGIDKYNNWYYEYKKERQPSHALLATGVGGVLYPPHCLKDKTFDILKIQNYCLNADDIWLKFMEIFSDIKVVYVHGSACLPYMIRGTQEISLNSSNVWKCENDFYIEKLEHLYNMELSEYID